MCDTTDEWHAEDADSGVLVQAEAVGVDGEASSATAADAKLGVSGVNTEVCMDGSWVQWVMHGQQWDHERAGKWRDRRGDQ